MDFYKIEERRPKGESLELHPAFTFTRSKDLMVRANDFYAIWDEEKGLWSTDEFDVIRLVDKDLSEARDKKKETFDGKIVVKWMHDSNSNSWYQFQYQSDRYYTPQNLLLSYLAWQNHRRDSYRWW